MQKGRFLSLEGVDGAGKSTHVDWVARCVRDRGVETVVTREPGGTPLGEHLRRLLLAESMHIDTEILLMFAARREHLAQVIWPALEAGKWVISDRFTDATYAYQGAGRGADLARIKLLEDWVQGAFQPDLTLVFHVPVEIAAQRRGNRAEKDRFEQLDRDFFTRVSGQYAERAARFSDRMRLIDGSQSVDKIKVLLKDIISSI